MVHRLEMQFSSLLIMDAGPKLNRALKTYILNTHKQTLYLGIKPQFGGFIDEDSISISILKSEKQGAIFLLKCSVFYEEKIGGCNCLDDPHSENGYFEIEAELSHQKFELA